MLRSCGGFNPEGVERYLSSGRETAELAFSLAREAGCGEPHSIRWLELGSGYGRVTRWLARDVAPDKIWAADVDAAAVRFCGREFGVRPAVSSESFHLDAQVRVDAALAISVLTHLPEGGAHSFLRLLTEVSDNGAVVIFTTHGEHSLRTLERYEDGRYAPLRSQLERSYAERGWAYTAYDYDPTGGYGMAWHSPAYVENLVQQVACDRFVRVAHRPHGLEGHQDLWVFRAGAPVGDTDPG